MTASAGVIGGGIFGVAAALEMRDLGVAVTLYERQDDILCGATAGNVFRVHRGYHYPRDLPTALECRAGYTPFLGMFAEALAPAVPAYYAIAAEGSLTSPDQFAEHCARAGLECRPVTLPVLVPGSVVACFEVDEFYYDPGLLRRVAWERLTRSGVQVDLGYAGTADAIASEHDVVVVTAYAGLNEVLAQLGCAPVLLQYESCEVAVVRTPGLRGLSLVVMDGPFCSVAPYGGGMHLLYDVDHSVHARTTGYASPGRSPGFSRTPEILGSVRRFVRSPAGVRHAGSLYAERVVLPGVDATDARPTRVWWAGDRVLAVLSGKVSTAVAAGREAAGQVAGKLALAAAS